MIKRLARVAPLQCGTVLAVLYGLLSLIFVPFFLLVLIFAPHDSQYLSAVGGLVVMAVGLPIGLAIQGFIVGVLGAFVYNLVAGWTGGLELTFVDVPPAIPVQTTNF